MDSGSHPNRRLFSILAAVAAVLVMVALVPGSQAPSRPDSRSGSSRCRSTGRMCRSTPLSPWGMRISQVTHNTDGSKEDAFYGYNPHTDVEQLTDDTGNTKTTYGYTAYGKNDEARFTGADKPDTADPTKEPFNAYRFNSKRWDQHSGNYDMGFRDYSPG